MRFKSLGSGSTGNATLVQSGAAAQREVGCTLLVDCGFGLKSLLLKLEKSGLAVEEISAIFITHEHGDHIGCVQALSAKYRIPVWMSAGTAKAMGLSSTANTAGLDANSSLLHIAADGVPIDLGDLQITPFTVPHDAREPLQLSCTDGKAKLGVLTDLGHATDHVLNHLQGCNALVLECNHDADLLTGSSYPAFLKHRVAGDYGHLSNDQAAAIAQAVTHSALRHVVAAHLSQQNNRPERAAHALSEALSCNASDIVMASADEGCAWLEV